MPTADTPPTPRPNPFTAQVASEADSPEALVDVPAIHDAARRVLLSGRSRVRAGRHHLTVLLGEEGIGKSHLIGWLRRQNPNPSDVFVSMAALPDVGQSFRHALRQLISALCRKDAGNNRSGPFERPIDRLLWDALYTQTCDLLDATRIGSYQGPGSLLKLIGPLCVEGGRRRELADFMAAAQPVWQQVEPGLIAYLHSLPTEQSIDSTARSVLVQYAYPDRRALCTAWLAGEELSAKDRERISAKQVINNESAAKYVLCALSRLLTAPAVKSQGQGNLLTLVYDQTDAVALQLGQPAVQAIAEVIAAIQAQGGNVHQILSCRPETWRLLLDKPTRPGPGQLKQIDDTIQLVRPPVQALREILLLRAGQTSPLPVSELDTARWPKQVATPRAALAYAASLWAARFEPQRTDSIPLPASDMPTAKGLPSAPLKPPAASARNAPSKPAAPATSGKTSTSRPGAAPASARNAPSKPAAPVTSGKTSTSRPGAVPVSAKLVLSGPVPSPAAKAALSTLDKVKSPAVPETVPPSSSSPSITWIAMAEDGEPPIAPINAAKSGASKENAKGSSSPLAKPAAKLDPQPIPPPEPSAQSPSVSWIAMASDEDPLAQALAAAAAKEEAAGQGGATRSGRTTKDRLRAVSTSPPANLREEQVITALGTRTRVEEWLLAQELGVSIAALSETLAKLEDQGIIRLLPLADGQRMVARL